MRPVFSILLALSTALPAAEELPGDPKKLSAVSLLPDGSELKGVMIPRHDNQHRLVSSLRAKIITLVSDEIISGSEVLIDFFNKDGSNRGNIHLARATIYQSKGMLESLQPVTINSEKFHAKGNGLHYAFQKSEGFLAGPVITWIKALTDTTMNSKSSSILGATGLALISQTVAITTPQVQAQEEKKPVMVNTVAASSPQQEQQKTTEQVEASRKVSDAATDSAKAFLDQASVNTDELLDPSKIAANTTPLEVVPTDKDTVISCDGGMYFDAENGLLVYLKNVKVDDPRFLLTGANELKIHLSQKEKKDAKDSKEPKKDGEKKSDKQASPIGNFDQVDRVIATGAVRILQRSVEKGKIPVEASGAIFTYRPSTGEILLSGGYPWVKQGSSFMRAKSPNLTLRIQKSGSFVTEGNWEMGGNLKTN